MRTDVAVIGLGAMGAATLYQLARRGIQVVGIDRYHPPHDIGSSHGETRITRCAVGEGEELVPLALRSHAIWRELESETGEALLDACGFLMMAPQGVRTGHHGKQDFLQRTVAAAVRHAIPHELLDAGSIARRFPAFELRQEEGYFEPGGGYVRPERCIAAQLNRAATLGATIVTGRTVLRVQPEGQGVCIDMAGETLTADRVVVAAGAWAADLLGPVFAGIVVPRRQTLHWFPTSDEASFSPGICPAYIWMYGSGPEDYFYGFPAQPGSGLVKVASEQYADATHPDTAVRTVLPEERAAMFSTHVAGRLRGVSTEPGRSAACLYTVTPDSRFIIDRHPDSERIIAVSPCSGHGFKHSAAIGEAVAELVHSGRSTIDLEPFRLSRFHTLPAAAK
jgi:sarcosine oxidase